MKEEANIAMGLLTTHKWQPSVLQLLPFSNNNVGVKRHAHGLPSAAYSENGPDRGFPLLAVTRTEKSGKPRSKSANVPVMASSSQVDDERDLKDGERQYGKLQQRRLFRASSERLARGVERTSAGAGSTSGAHNEKYKTKLRARSDYGISTFYKRPEVVKISVNDINEQILGKKRVQSAVTGEDGLSIATCESPEGALRARLKEGAGGGGGGIESRSAGKEGTKGNRTALPKSALKPTQGKWPNSGMTFWSSATTAPSNGALPANQRSRGENETGGSSRGSTARGEHYFRRDGRRVKLNVNDLPRSKTPIADNDPDKLNMQHVIAFLQSSGGGKEGGETGDVLTGKPGQLPSFPIKRSAINGVITASPDQNGLVSIRPSHTVRKSGASSPVKNPRLFSEEEKDMTPHRLSFNTAKNQSEDQRERVMSGVSSDSHSRPGTESLELYRKTRVLSTSNGGSLQYSDYKTQHVVSGDNFSHGTSGYPDLQDIHIPLSIRKIRERNQAGDTKPFRLHRFLTLVPNGSETLLNAPEKNERSAGGAAQSKPLGSRDKRRAFRNSSGSEKGGREKRLPLQRKSHPDSNLYYLDMNTPFDDRPQSKGDSRSGSRSRQQAGRASETEAEQLRKDVQRVIRLPRAHYEPESDEEGSPYCTVPAARNRRALTLSAQGKAIKDIISENNNKLSAALHNADRSVSQHGDTLKDKTAAALSKDKSAVPSEEVLTDPTAAQSAEVSELNPGEPTTSTRQISEASAPVRSPTMENLNTQLAQKAEVTTEQASAVTFRDMLDLRSDPGVSSTSKDDKTEPPDPGSTTFLTQAPQSFSRPHSEKAPVEQRRVSPSSKSQTNSRIGLPPIAKRDGKGSGGSPSPTRDHVKLSLRKEKTKTREHTYMFVVDSEGVESLSPSPK